MAPSGAKRRLTTIFAADVEGYSRLMRADEEATLATLKTYREIIDGLIARHDGRVFGSAGDSVIAEFGSAVEAVRAAISIQEELRVRNAELTETRRMNFRIGINVGDVMVEGDNLFGDGVNVAARLEGLAEAGGICISGSAFEQVKNKLTIGFEDMGPQEVKNIDEPVSAFRLVPGSDATPAKTSRPARGRRQAAIAAAAAVVVLAIAGAVAWLTVWAPSTQDVATAETPDKPSIAVLPFQNLSDDPNQEYFSDGITNDIITDLSRFSNLFVIASHSVFTYKGKPVNVKDVGRDLGVRYVLEGSIQKVGNSVRINAQLIDATTDHHLWAERYDRELDDIFAVQDELTASIVAALQITLTEDEKTRVARQYTDNIEAYDLFLRGRSYLRGTKRTHLQARQLFDEAIELDPTFAAAYAEKSMTYFANFIMPMEDPKVLETALEAAERAVVLDDSLPLAHARLGWVYLARMRHEEAIAEGRRAIALDPNDADSYAQLGNILNWAGKPEEGIGLIEKAMRLNPHYPFSYLFYLGHAHYLLGHNDEAIALMKRAVTRAPDFLPGHRHLAVLYQESGRPEEARAEVAAVLRIFAGASIEDSRQRCLYVREPALLERFFDGMRKAGMPEGVPGEKPMKM